MRNVTFSREISLGSVVSWVMIVGTLIGCYANFKTSLTVLEMRQMEFSKRMDTLDLVAVSLRENTVRLQAILDERRKL